MDKLLLKHCVAAAEIEKLAKNISRFHQQTDVIFSKRLKDIKNLFNDLKRQENFLQSHLLCHGLIANAIKISNEFFSQNEPLFTRRLQGGYMRDCHGDLHAGNIFLLPEPQPFDCIEFNDDFRRIDVLDEIAFLCMDLGALAERDLTHLFLEHYNLLFPAMQTKEEMLLFIYYKAYRANIRAKVNSLKAANAVTATEKEHALHEVNKYLLLMNKYLHKISQGRA